MKVDSTFSHGLCLLVFALRKVGKTHGRSTVFMTLISTFTSSHPFSLFTAYVPRSTTVRTRAITPRLKPRKWKGMGAVQDLMATRPSIYPLPLRLLLATCGVSTHFSTPLDSTDLRVTHERRRDVSASTRPPPTPLFVGPTVLRVQCGLRVATPHLPRPEPGWTPLLNSALPPGSA